MTATRALTHARSPRMMLNHGVATARDLICPVNRPNVRREDRVTTGNERQDLSLNRIQALGTATTRLRSEFHGIFGVETIDRFLHFLRRVRWAGRDHAVAGLGQASAANHND